MESYGKFSKSAVVFLNRQKSMSMMTDVPNVAPAFSQTEPPPKESESTLEIEINLDESESIQSITMTGSYDGTSLSYGHSGESTYYDSTMSTKKSAKSETSQPPPAASAKPPEVSKNHWMSIKH